MTGITVQMLLDALIAAEHELDRRRRSVYAQEYIINEIRAKIEVFNVRP